MNLKSIGPDAAGGLPPHDFKAKAAEEFRRFVGLFLYLWILFGVFALNQGIVMREDGVPWAMEGFALVNALVFAKVMMLFELFDPGAFLRRRPLIYPILYESFLLMVLFLVVHVAERVLVGAIHGKTVAESLPTIGGGGVAGMLSASVIVFVALTPYFALRNLDAALGPGRLAALMFGSAAPPADAGER